MRQRIDLTGRKVGKWSVVCVDKTNTDKRYVKWICECECGTKASLVSNTLIHNRTRQCRPCSNKEKPRNTFPCVLWSSMKHNAKKRKIRFDVTGEYLLSLLEKQKSKCALSGVDIVLCNAGTVRGKGESSASLDRIDSSKPYTEGNVQWVHKVVNKMKMVLSQEEFIKWCKLIAKNCS